MNPSFRKPPALHAGARVALVAPAGPITAERLQNSLDRCRALDLEPVLYPSATQRLRYLAGSDAQRFTDLQHALDADDVAAVWALRGGYGAMRILNRLDLRGMLAHPKAFIGFSDNTAIHARLAQNRLVSFHGPHPGADFPSATEYAFRRVLFQAEPAGRLPVRAADPAPRTLVGGRVEAPLIGGNLALLGALCGTAASISARGHILFLEDVGEPAYRVDRLLMQLRDSGVLDGVLGLALGRFSEVPDTLDDDVEWLLSDYAQTLDVPTIIDLPIGHVEHNWTLPIGVHALLDADAARVELIEAAVTE